jgi:hypothetical protein
MNEKQWLDGKKVGPMLRLLLLGMLVVVLGCGTAKSRLDGRTRNILAGATKASTVGTTLRTLHRLLPATRPSVAMRLRLVKRTRAKISPTDSPPCCSTSRATRTWVWSCLPPLQG